MDPYRTRDVPAINLANSSRLDSLVRAGNLYLTAQDVVALAIENNIDVEVQRYAPLLAREVLKRAQGGGVLRAVGSGVAAGPQSVSLQGVSLTGGSAGSAGSGVSSGGGILTQLGPSIPTLDPTISAFANFQHTTSPQSNTVLTGTNAFVADTRTYQASYSQNWLFGLGATMSYSSQYTKVNSNFYTLNPYTSGNLDLQLTQNLLQGFGSAVNGRNIRVQKNNLKVTDLQFKLQLITTISAVLNLYWDLVSFQQDVQAREQAVKTAQQLYDDNKRMVEVGTLAEIEVTRAESQLYAAKQDLVISRTNLLQQETVLKNALSRSGVASAELASVHIVALDRIAPPDAAEIGELEKLVAEAAEKRPEIQQSRINLESNNLNLVGIKNSLKPTLQAFAELTNNGLTGDLTALGLAAGAAGSPLVGGYGNLLGQIARRNYPNYSAGFSLNIPLRNRAAQSDYVTSLIEIRQNELNLQKTLNQVRVDVQNAMIGLEQAKARYDAARTSRTLALQTLEADQKKFSLGASTSFQVVQDQRDLANAQSSEVQAMANYTHARISLEQALGRTLDVNHVSVEEAMRGNGGPASKGPDAGQVKQ
ncbi:TolC family protein [Paludibaculum fermentans]|uniref:TolC family protein n=1 Tax=Paludibaculum fermentans TaxID=1473598 RepID=A0A7S7NQF8_PALFE|nr:TolC family protein [Paludibaculum fermentans]QOY87419.1 TolC family protein [Paludibaculum fermentans]